MNAPAPGTVWRTGRKVLRTIYTHTGDTENGQLVGILDTPELAAYVVDACNAQEAVERAEIERQAREALAAELDETAAALPGGWSRVRGLADGLRRAAAMARREDDLTAPERAAAERAALVEEEIRARLHAELEAEIAKGWPTAVTAGLTMAQKIIRGEV